MTANWIGRILKKMRYAKGFAQHEYTKRPMTAEEIKGFEESFELFDEAFDKMDQAFSKMDAVFFKKKK